MAVLVTLIVLQWQLRQITQWVKGRKERVSSRLDDSLRYMEPEK